MYQNQSAVILGVVGLCAVLGILCAFSGGANALRQVGGMEGLTTAVQATMDAESGIVPARPTPVGDVGSPSTGNANDLNSEVSVYDLQLGQCINIPAETMLASTVMVVDCIAPHGYEIFHSLDYDAGGDDPFPGEDAIKVFAEAECVAAFEPYVGRNYVSSVYHVSYFYPSEDTWPDGDREIVCLLREPDTQLEGSARNSGR